MIPKIYIKFVIIFFQPQSYWNNSTQMNLTIYKTIIASLIALFYTNSTFCRADNLHYSQNYLKFAIPVKLDPLDPAKSVNAHTKMTLSLIYEPLVAINAEQNLKPVLAE